MPLEPSRRLDDTTAAGYGLRPVLRIQDGIAEQVDDYLAQEVPVAVHYDGVPFAVMMATPADLEDFAHGFSLSESRVIAPARIVAVNVFEGLEGIELDVCTDQAANAAAVDNPRLLPGRSGCGICGSRTLEDVVKRPATIEHAITIDDAVLERALDGLRRLQPINAVTGSVHAAAWANLAGDVLLVREDVGRHNALDKLIGAMLRQGLDRHQGFLLITSRASYEMVTKAAMAGMAMMAAISAPTALAVHLARDCGVTLIGFARPGRHVVYSHAQRLLRSD